MCEDELLTPHKGGIVHKTGIFTYQTSTRRVCGHSKCSHKVAHRGFIWDKNKHSPITAWFCDQHTRCVVCGTSTHERRKWGNNNYLCLCQGCSPPTCNITGCDKSAFTFKGVVPVCRTHQKCIFLGNDGYICNNRAGIDVTLAGNVYSVCKSHLHNGAPLDERCLAMQGKRRCIMRRETHIGVISLATYNLCLKHYKQRRCTTLCTIDPHMESIVGMFGSKDQVDRLSTLPQAIFNNIAIWLNDKDLLKLMNLNKKMSTLIKTYSINMFLVTIERFTKMNILGTIPRPDRHSELMDVMISGVGYKYRKKTNMVQL